MMNYSSEMVTCLFYFLFILFLAGHGASLDCIRSCGKHGPKIRFPFRIKDKQADHCGYPGFDLSCSEGKDTMLELPTGVKLRIERIDYRHQVIHARDSQCFFLRRLNFSLSASHFQIKDDWMCNQTLFNCSSNGERSPNIVKIPCLSTFHHEVYAAESSHSKTIYYLCLGPIQVVDLRKLNATTFTSKLKV
ncbi:unnamed protein product [Dovyalis caffra]|uniref:RING-type E3 ubiquitin transferase n=1 Tax=Dovyalis caffra TaxID=77055 RepID=A0AAV1RD93_9ROSI|nr:unnamed protein product [Dovyalis caffra]CAK7334075.1 unnamed protein product [Dovyalis caffra]